MKATYNSIGQMIDEKWYNVPDLLVAHYKYLYSAEGNVVQSLDIILNKVYDYIYEAGKLIRSVESDVEFDDNAEFKVLGKKIEITVDIASWIIDRVIKCIGVF